MADMALARPWPRRDVGSAVATMIQALGTGNFSEALLKAMSGVVVVDHCAAFMIGPGKAPPVLLLATSRHDAAFAQRAARRYADEYWRFDPAMASVRGRGRPATIRLTWNAIHHTPFREECYVTAGVIDRLSVLAPAGDGAHMLLSVFRLRETGFFHDSEASRFAAAADLFIACIRKHTRLLAPIALGPAPGLSEREGEVAQGFMAGQTVRDIAAALGLSPSTVETYRKRIYAKLGVSSRIGLARCLAGQASGPHGGRLPCGR